MHLETAAPVRRVWRWRIHGQDLAPGHPDSSCQIADNQLLRLEHDRKAQRSVRHPPRDHDEDYPERDVACAAGDDKPYADDREDEPAQDQEPGNAPSPVRDDRVFFL